MINCHGHLKETGNTEFWFEEDLKSPSIIDKFDEKRLLALFKKDKSLMTSLKLVIISACYSSRLAKILYDAGLPAVVSIDSRV